MPTPKQNSDHFRRLDIYSKAIDAIYQQAIQEASALIRLAKYDPDKPFSFDNYPLAKQRMNKIISELTNDLQAKVLDHTQIEWNLSNLENDELVKSVFPTVPVKNLAGYSPRNLEALKAFQQRKDKGIGLSDRIWNYTQQFKQEFEMSIDVALSDGRSAQQLSRDMRGYLNEPDRLFRRVRDKRGNLQLSKNAKAYHPGQGKYRSSYKNAMRVARTEVNMAYRMSDHQRRQQMPFIVGFEVRLSNNHPVFDICDHLKGRYPKDFVYRGWHPQCRCNCISVMASREELSKMTDQVLAGQDITVGSANTVKSPPDGLSQWWKDNKQRSEGWSSKPYFMKDNPGYFNPISEKISSASEKDIYNYISSLNPKDQFISSLGRYTSNLDQQVSDSLRREIMAALPKDTLAYKIIQSDYNRFSEKQLWVLAYELKKNASFSTEVSRFYGEIRAKEMRKINQSKEKKALNKALSSDILFEVKNAGRNLGDYYKWLNTSGNPYRKEYFSKKYSKESVSAFLSKK